MIKDGCRGPGDLEGFSHGEKERAVRAGEIYSRLCEEAGIGSLCFENFEAWKAFVEGEIGESQLNEEARKEVEEFSRSFGKYLMVDSREDRRQEREEEEKRERARRANKIYRKVCSECGMQVCFFQDFSSWSDYVEGRISDEAFEQRARAEIEKIRARSQSPR